MDGGAPFVSKKIDRVNGGSAQARATEVETTVDPIVVNRMPVGPLVATRSSTFAYLALGDGTAAQRVIKSSRKFDGAGPDGGKPAVSTTNVV